MRSRLARPAAAFTLVELLTVITVILVLLGLCVPVMTAMKSASDVSRAVYDVAGVLGQARAYAMGNNTYVYVGLAEYSAANSSSGAQTPGVGRVVMATVATRDGTQGFSAGSLPNWSAAYPAFTRNLTAVGKPVQFENLHVPDLGPPPTTGGMVRPLLSNGGGTNYSLGNASCVSATPFDYPPNSPLHGGKYSFTEVIQFDPQGVARIQSASNPAAITSYLEIGLQQTHGLQTAALPASPTTGNIAAVQVDGMTGVVRIYRP